MRTLAIDPGRDNGWSIYSDRWLVDCGLGDPPLGIYSFIVAERPQIYERGDVDPNDIVTLAIRLGRQLGRFPESPIGLVLPAKWKGQVPKPIHNRRVLDALSPAEEKVYLACGVSESKRHNVIDAIGLGKWALTNRHRCDKFKV